VGGDEKFLYKISRLYQEDKVLDWTEVAHGGVCWGALVSTVMKLPTLQ
jgi:hypothetical protein